MPHIGERATFLIPCGTFLLYDILQKSQHKIFVQFIKFVDFQKIL
jgi:hypothetical protein